MIWTLLILGIFGLLGWGTVKLYQVLVMLKVKDFKDIHGNSMKGTKPTFIIGDVLSEYLFPQSLASKVFLQYGDVYYRWFFWKPTLMLVDHEGIHRVLNESDAYRKNTPLYQAFSENSELADQCETIKAVFNDEHMEILSESVVGMASSFCDQLVDAQGSGVSFNVFNTSLAYTREVLGTVLYGDTFSARQIMTAQRELASISTTRAFIRRIFPTLAKMAPSFFGIEQATELSAGLSSSIEEPSPNTVLGFLQEHRKSKDKKHKKGINGDKEEEQINEDEKEFDKDRNIRMEDEIKAKHKLRWAQSDVEKEEKERAESLRLKQSVSNIIGFYTTGIDTTASVLTSVFFMLMRNQDMQSHLREEIIKELDGEPVTYGRIKKVKALSHFIKETLRLHPPYPILYPRVSRRSDRLVGFHIPKKTNVIVDVVGHNRHPKYWSNPDTFDPTRYSKNPGASKYVLVWGSGPQEKVARALGLLVLRCTIATLLLKYQIVCGATDPSHKVNRIKFERSVGSLRPHPDLIGRVAAIPDNS